MNFGLGHFLELCFHEPKAIIYTRGGFGNGGWQFSGGRGAHVKFVEPRQKRLVLFYPTNMFAGALFLHVQAVGNSGSYAR